MRSYTKKRSGSDTVTVMKNQEMSDYTKGILIDIARSEFTCKGYANASLEEIVRRANLTRGALYHHFGNKLGLFRSVLETVQADVAHSIETEASKCDDLWEQFIVGCWAFIAAALKPENRRILLIDGPSVLGWEEWSEIDDRNSESLLRQHLQIMKENGLLKDASVTAISSIISGALNEAALWIANSEDTDQAMNEAKNVITIFLNSFRK